MFQDLNLAAYHSLVELRTAHPSFTPPLANVDEFNEWTFTEPVAFAGWGGADPRKVLLLSSLRRVTLWSQNSDLTGQRSDEGDSGGPLFKLRAPDFIRDPVGVTTGQSTLAGQGEFLFNVWADITQEPLTQFVRDNARVTRSLKWRNKHGKLAADVWWGDVDYTGPCNPSRDRDCDHWYDEHDNCPSFNPSQDDTDDDGFGDACDTCVLVPNDYANCNDLSERINALGARPLGDECDPVPCPSSDFNPARWVETCRDIVPGFPQEGQTCTGRMVRSRLTTTTLASRSANGAGSVVANVETVARFCQEQLATRPDLPLVRCDTAVAIKDDQLTFAEVPRNPDRPWHPVRFGNASQPLGTPPPRGQTFRWNYGATISSNRWFFDDDFSFWMAQQPIPLIPVATTDLPRCAGGAVAGTCLDGLFWLHANTSVGAAEHGSQLANTYVDWTPDPVRVYCPTHQIPPLGSRMATAGLWATGVGTLGEFLWPPLSFDYAFDVSSSQPETRLVVPADRGILGALRSDGSLISLASDDTACGGRFVDGADRIRDVPWISIAEPSIIRARRDQRLLAFRLSNDATTLVDVLMDIRGSAKLLSDLEASGTVDLGPGTLFLTQTAGGPHPPPRSEHVVVASERANGVFVIGGRNATGARLSDAWFQPLAGPWVELSLGATHLGDPLAATYSASDEAVWVVDARDRDDDDDDGRPRTRRSLRVLRINPSGAGTSQALRLHRQSHAADARAFLSADIDGSVLLAIAGERRFDVLRLELDRHQKHVIARRVLRQKGRLARAPIVDRFGYSFVLEDASGQLVIHRRSTLKNRRCDDDRDDDDDSRRDGHHEPSECVCSSFDLDRLL